MFSRKKNKDCATVRRKKFSFTQIFILTTISFFATSVAVGEVDLPKHDRPNLELNKLQNKSLTAVQRAAEQGFCSPDFYDAGLALKDLIFHETSAEYKSGKADTVWNSNEGVRAFFKDQLLTYPEMSEDKAALADRLLQMDRDFPIQKLGGHGPSLDSKSHYDAYAEALKITKGNVFRAVSLIGNLGHDDVGNITADSNLFAPLSIGVSVPNDVVEKFKEAGERCQKTHNLHSEARSCNGAGSSFNYHVNFGFFLGCYLARKGFGQTSVSKIFADGAIAALNDPYLEKELAEQAHTGKLLNRQYQFNVCSDVPKLLGYFYKRTTMARFLTEDAKFLYEQGYRQPFLERDHKNTVAIPPDWPNSRWQAAIANLDYRLMHLEYGSKQAEAGAKKGAEVCSNYAAESKPPGLSPDAELLYRRGNFNPEKTVAELYRVPEELKANPEKLAAAWNELSNALKAIRHRFDYADAPAGTADPDRHIDHLVNLRADQDVLHGYAVPLKSKSTIDESAKAPAGPAPILLGGLADLSDEELLAYLRRKAARRPLTNENTGDAERRAQLLAWSADNNPKLQKKMVTFLDEEKSDYLKYVSLSALKLLNRSDEHIAIVARLITNAQEPLLSEAIRVLLKSSPIAPEGVKAFISRVESIDPRNLSQFVAEFQRDLPKDGKRELADKVVLAYGKLPDDLRNELLQLMEKKIRTYPSVRNLAVTQLKSHDPERVRTAMYILKNQPLAIESAKPDLIRWQNGEDSSLANLAKSLLSELESNDVSAEKK